MSISTQLLPTLKPQTESEWLEIMQEPSKMRDRIYACQDYNDIIKISMMSADTAGLDELSRMTIMCYMALCKLDDHKDTNERTVQ